MSRIEQLEKTKGSQHWLQLAVNTNPNAIDAKIRATLALKGDESIVWRSPLENDKYSEYSDQQFLKKVGLEDKIKA